MVRFAQNNCPKKTGKAGPATAGSLFPLEVKTSGRVTLADFHRSFPNVPIRALAFICLVAVCDNSVNPFRLCACGCGASVHGKATLAGPACRKRVSREKVTMRLHSGRQFNLPLQGRLI
jgi:hypothetical protein